MDLEKQPETQDTLLHLPVIDAPLENIQDKIPHRDSTMSSSTRESEGNNSQSESNEMQNNEVPNEKMEHKEISPSDTQPRLPINPPLEQPKENEENKDKCDIELSSTIEKPENRTESPEKAQHMKETDSIELRPEMGKQEDKNESPEKTQSIKETNSIELSPKIEKQENRNVSPEKAQPMKETNDIELNSKIEKQEKRNESPEKGQPVKKTTDSFYPHFILPQVSIIGPTEDLFARIKNELQQFGEIVKLELMNESENMADVNLSFVHDKDAVIALKSTIRVNLSDNNQNSNSTIQMQPAPSFKKYLIDLSSALKLQKAPKASTPKKEEVSKPISPPPSQTEEKSPNMHSLHKNENKSMETEGLDESKQKVLVIGSLKRNEVPLEIVKPTKLVKSSVDHSSSDKVISEQKASSDSRSRSRSNSKEKDNIRKNKKGNGSDKKNLFNRQKGKNKREFREDRDRRKGSFNRERDFVEEERPFRDNQRILREIRHSPNRRPMDQTFNRGFRGENGMNSIYPPQEDSWTDNDYEAELVCYAIGIPIEYDERYFRDLLQRNGYSGHIKMKWRDFEGLDYLKIVFDNRNDAQRFLQKPVFVHEIPIIIMPKLQGRNPLEMLVYHQLRLQSVDGSIEAKLAYDFLSKFGLITDFLVLDSLQNPTTFLVTFTSNAPKRLIAGCYPNNIAIINDASNCERKIQIDLNIKPALVVRKKLSHTIVFQYKEAQRQYQVLNKPIQNTIPYQNQQMISPMMTQPPLNYSPQNRITSQQIPLYNLTDIPLNQIYSQNYNMVSGNMNPMPMPLMNEPISQDIQMDLGQIPVQYIQNNNFVDYTQQAEVPMMMIPEQNFVQNALQPSEITPFEEAPYICQNDMVPVVEKNVPFDVSNYFEETQNIMPQVNMFLKTLETANINNWPEINYQANEENQFFLANMNKGGNNNTYQY